MSVLMKGADVANAMKEDLINRVECLKEKGVAPCMEFCSSVHCQIS